MSYTYNWWTNVEACKWKRSSKIPLEREKVTKHPLESSSPHLIKVSYDPFEGLDPLSANLTELDPLTRMVMDQGAYSNTNIPSIRDTFEPWSVRKGAILNRFTTQEKLSITTSIFSSDIEVRGVSEKVLHRLEQLDLDGGSKQFFGGLTQEEYILKINQLHQQLTEAWQSDLKVNALKIVIQCCKLMGDTTVIGFYPSKFVLVTDILDKFGNMVYTRLKGKQQSDAVLSANWFYKVSSIRELLPRLCIELSILKSYSFIDSSPEYSRILVRLLNCMWGIGDPVVAIYLRCYLCRVAMELVPNDKELFMKCFQDLLLLHDQVLDNFRNSPQLADAKVSMETYMMVLGPAVDWIFQCNVHRGEHLQYTLQLVSNVPPFWKSVLLGSVLATFPPSFVSEESSNILDMIMSLEANLGEILKNLGLCLIVVGPHNSQCKDMWLKIWALIRKIHNREAYLDCSVVWMEFVVKNFGPDKVSSFLEDVMRHVSLQSLDKYYGKLVSIVEKLLLYSPDITMLLKMDKFVKMVNILPPESSKAVLAAFNAKHTSTYSDNILVSTLTHLASKLHDSVDALTPVDEVKQVGGVINGFILRVNYGRDYEKLLEFYDEARGAFTNIDSVLIQLIQCVCRLGMEVGYVVSGHHTKRTRGFLSACIAYAFITIPSLENYFTQLQLYHLTSQLAYSNQCVSQGDASLKAAINLLNEYKEDFDCGEPLLVEFVCNLLSTLLAVPDHPKESMLYLLKALMTIKWNSSIVQLRYLSLLGSYAQQEYPYSFNSVETNNELYGGAKQFITEIDSLAATVLNDLLSTVKYLGNQPKLQGKLCLDIFWEIVYYGDISKMGSLAVSLWTLANNSLEPYLISKCIESLRLKANSKEEFLILLSSKLEAH